MASVQCYLKCAVRRQGCTFDSQNMPHAPIQGRNNDNEMSHLAADDLHASLS